ncbi:MAG: glycoside hydrolase family 97 protein [Prevotella sp.]|nr:glycoside hydrolase family 97 protein [Prevotella sp.]
MKIHKLLAALGAVLTAFSATAAPFILTSPDGKISAEITAGKNLKYSVSYNGQTLMQPSEIGMTLTDGTVVGRGKAKVIKRTSVDEMVKTPVYRHDKIRDHYNGLTLSLGKQWRVEFRAYNDGVAYRFVTTAAKPLRVEDETAEYTFSGDVSAIAPYVRARHKKPDFESQFFSSFENIYTTTNVDGLDPGKLIFLPMAVEPAPDVKVLITESDLEGYPGMYLNRSDSGKLSGVWAPYPKMRQQGGHNNLQMLVQERWPYIADSKGARSFPWRIMVIGDDKTLATSDLSYLLGKPPRIADTSWIKPGKVAWDWWNAWNIRNVDFKSGINNDTYNAYIDFASKNGIEYVILDEGWAVNKKADLMQVVPEIDLPMLVKNAADKNVGLILWAGYIAFDRDMEKVVKHYAEMGIKGFKVDFMDADDQIINDFLYRASETAARNKVLLDFHGTAKPAGLNRTYPNVINFEGVNGLEQMKWSPDTLDQMLYDVQIPFLRQASGPMDYTQGAMRNATKRDYYPVYDDPMSQGTRAHQLALYMVFDSPLNMLCDSPSNYTDEQECTDFIASVPTVWDETRVLQAKLGEYIVTARRKGDKWYIGGITNWTPRDIVLDLSFLPEGTQLDVFTDGVNANRNARDYKRTVMTASPSLKLHLAPGGGFALRAK